MARVIFLATVLVALCYTSQALPSEFPSNEIKTELEQKLKDTFERLKERLEKVKEHGFKDSTPVVYSGQGEQYLLNDIFKGVFKIVDETLQFSQDVINEIQECFRELGPNKYTAETKVVGLLDDIKSKLQEEWNKIEKQIKEMKDKAENVTKDILEEGKNWVEDTMNQGKEKINEFREKAKEIVA
ncbi:PREDICTED: uncharacterized protein LOC106741885 [Dinoponera quadriceps]|uniref:Uncharacterized protein LOC106741885 n=1 Tax=Dinoponera quadriceps TaxID=609295 RepID=A0A6P3WUJ6_DINQU|nr:PREDICTED: uncharacterized protein LOC106741885 [Dinoponera quadriceps]